MAGGVTAKSTKVADNQGQAGGVSTGSEETKQTERKTCAVASQKLPRKNAFRKQPGGEEKVNVPKEGEVFVI